MFATIIAGSIAVETHAGDERVIRFNVPRGPASETLRAAALQGEVEIIYTDRTARGVRTNRVKGLLTADSALEKLVAGTPLEVVVVEEDNAYAVSRTETPEVNSSSEDSPEYKSFLSKLASLSASSASNRSKDQSSALLDDEFYELSPFFVQASDDLGYRATATLSGSRLNTRLKDTAASVSVFTKEFLDDTGFLDLQEVVGYSVGTVNDTQDISPSVDINSYLGASRNVRNIRIRGVQATKGINYFESIIPDDLYRTSRYDESRGPNGLLFGISNAGGIINSSTLLASTYEDSGRVRAMVGSYDERRLEGSVNKVLLPKVLGVTLAGVTQDAKGWRKFAADERDRIYGAATWRPSRKATFRLMGEVGNHFESSVRPFLATDEVTAWLRNRDLLGLDAVTAIPGGASNNPSRDQQALGVVGTLTGRNSTRYVLVENDGAFFNGAGTWVTGSYDDKDVAPVPGSFEASGVEADAPARFVDPEFYPFHLNAAGPGMLKESDFETYMLSTDLGITEDLVVNLAHNFQRSDLFSQYMHGDQPALRGDPNVTLRYHAPSELEDPSLLNPNVGELYFDAQWRKEFLSTEYEETRLSFSYDLDLRSDAGFGFGKHRIAASVSERTVENFYTRWVNAFLGAPFTSRFDGPRNRLTIRKYIAEGDFSSYVVGQPSDLDTVMTVVDDEGITREVGWVRARAGTSNSGSKQRIESRLLVLLSEFFGGKLAATLGYRMDDGLNIAYGHDTSSDPLRGPLLVEGPDAAGYSENGFSGRSKTLGVVYHLHPNVSLIANYASSIGLPKFSNKVLPDGNIGPPVKGEGVDLGVAFELLGNKISGRLVYFDTDEKNRSTSGGVRRRLSEPNLHAIEAFTEVFDSLRKPDGSPYTEAEWQQTAAELSLDFNSVLENNLSSGVELSLVANPTRNWRLAFNASYTDRIRSDYAHRAIDWLGWRKGPDGRLVNGIEYVEGGSEGGAWSVDKSVYQEGRATRRILEIAENAVGWDASTIITSNDEESVAETLFLQMAETQQEIDTREKRWGLSPYKANVFTSYDFNEGLLKGFRIGGGVRWISASVNGEDLAGNEIMGEPWSAVDFVLRYRDVLGAGYVTYQLNVYNLLDADDLLPIRHSILTDSSSPLSRYQLPDPRTFRASVSYSF